MTFVGRYVFFFLPKFLSSILFWIWALLACLEPDHEKGHHFLGNMLLCRFPAFSSLSLQLSLRSSWSLLKGNWNLFTDMCCLLFLKCWQRVKCSYPPHFAQELRWKDRLIRTSGLHFEILLVATLLLGMLLEGTRKIIQDLKVMGDTARPRKISKLNAMPCGRISLTFQHNSWTRKCRLLHLSLFYH